MKAHANLLTHTAIQLSVQNRHICLIEKDHYIRQTFVHDNISVSIIDITAE